MIITIIYSDSGPGQADNDPKPNVYDSIVIPAAKRMCVKVPCMDMGYLKQLVVDQVGGTDKAFTVDLYNSELPFAEGEHADSASPSVNAALYRVIPQQSITSGSALDLAPDYEVGWSFRNMDGDWTNNQRYLYLVITPTASAGETTFEAMLTFDDSQFE